MPNDFELDLAHGDDFVDFVVDGEDALDEAVACALMEEDPDEVLKG